MTVLESQQVSTNPDHQRVAEACDRLLRECPPQSCSEQQFLEAQFDAGLAWVHFPLGNGGLGVSPGLQREVISALSACGWSIA